MASLLTFTLLFFAGAAFASEDYLGTKASIEDFPSLVQVETRVLLLWTQICSGSVLTSRHILTTATCFSGPLYLPELRRMRAGSSVRGTGGYLYEVEREYNHPTFGELDYDGDVSVVRLRSYLTFSPSIAQASILGQGIELPEGLRVNLAGWGNTMQGAESSADNYLYNLDVFVSNSDHCMEKYLTAPEPKYITENMMCFGLRGAGRDFDYRDHSSPLYYDGVVTGIISFGVNTGEDNYPVVATAIGSYTAWISETATYL